MADALPPPSPVLAVVGAGPAGLAAAVTAAELGLSVLVVDAGGQIGGQYWRQPEGGGEVPAAGPRGGLGSTWSTRTRADLRSRFDALLGAGQIHYLPRHQVWFVERADAGFVLRVEAVTGTTQQSFVRATALVLCPGGYDRQLPIPGWDLPGVMTAGGVQAMIKAHHLLPGRRAVVAGTGPFLLPVATGLAQSGATVVEVCEANSPVRWLPELPAVLATPSKLGEGAGYARTLARHRVPYRVRSVVTAIEGDDEVRAVVVAPVDAAGRICPGRERRHEVDLVALGWGFTPSLELATALGARTRVDVDESLVGWVDAEQRSSVPGLYLAGEATGVGGAVLAVAEGELAGRTAAADAGRPGSRRRRAAAGWAVRRGRAFASSLHRAHPVPAHWSAWLRADTIVCRCEEVDYGQICAARDTLGADDARTVKLLARPGMGWCQGKVCGYAVAKLAGSGPLTVVDLAPGSKRSLAAPVTLRTLAESGRADLEGPR